MKHILAALMVLFLAGCTALAEDHKNERKALRDAQKAEMKVGHKKAALNAANAVNLASIALVAKAQKDLKEAEKELAQAQGVLTTTIE